MGAPGAHPFALDPFQVEALEALDRGEGVLVAAPTGSGKTVVAEHAIDQALAGGGKAFYTTPIKALSNQKYHDLVGALGADRVGLLTGDTSRNPDAPVLVMTTEVLRNMLYRGADALAGLAVVVLDEVHYLQDPYRGPVWEEVIIHLDPTVRLVCLSATVSNADELGAWLRTVRGPTAVVVEHRRPVRLTNHYVVDDRRRERGSGLTVLPTLVGDGPDPRPNPDGAAYDRGEGAQRRGRRPFAPPHRPDLVRLLARRDLLPAIWFIFSRQACDDAVRSLTEAGTLLTTDAERARIRAVADRHLAGLGPDDRRVLGHAAWLAALETGVAAHHAGLVPPFKEAVEACFVEGLVKVVFATETLALGINMPARSVVIEKLTKFTGERHELLTPAQYTQLTGRAGRRGIDDEGHALVLWSPFVEFATVAGLAASREFELTSAFRPTYNMAANLVRRCDPQTAHRLLNLSFAQFQTDRAVVQLEVDLAERRRELVAVHERLAASGDPEAVAALVEAAAAELGGGADRVGAGARAVADALSALAPGDVVRLPGPRPEVPSRPVAVLSVAQRAGGPKLRVVTSARKVRTVGVADFREPPEVLARLDLPRTYRPEHEGFQREVAQRLARAGLAGDRRPPRPDPATARLARRAARLDRAVAQLEARIEQRNESLARRFDQLLQLLDAWGYLDGWALTARGERLAAVYHESDLLVTEAIETGLFDTLEPASLAGVASCLVYEHRSSAPPEPPWFPSAKVRHRVTDLERLAAELADDEHRAGLVVTRPPDPGFFALAHAWVAGDDLGHVLEDEVLAPGDFVRTVKQLVDLLRQIAELAEAAPTRDAARRAADAALRGVVLASTRVADEP